MRHLLCKTFKISWAGIPDIHESKANTREQMESVKLDKTYGFYKSHLVNNAEIGPDKILYIYRHPLDVFLSALNHFKNNNVKHLFKNGEIKSVDQIVSDRELDFYFDDFCSQLGKNYWPNMLKQQSSFEEHTRHALKLFNCVTLRYEDLLDRPEETLVKSLARLLPCEQVRLPENLFKVVDATTKHSGKPFFWKANKNTHLQYLSTPQIARFYDEHETLLYRLGYGRTK